MTIGKDIRVTWTYVTTKKNRTTTTTENITGFVTSIGWSGSDVEAARTLELSLINSPHDKQMKVPTLKKGDRITFYEGGIRLFYGKITSREKSGEKGEVSYTAKDFMDNLLKSKINTNFKGKTAEYIARACCRMVGIKYGSLVKTKTRIPRLPATETAAYNVILKAYKKASIRTGIQYFPRMNGSKFEIIEKGQLVGRGYNSQKKRIEQNYILHQNHNITGARISDNVDSMVNKVAIFNAKGKRIGTVSNANWIKAYGTYQEAYKQESKKEKHSKKKAKALLKGAEQSIEIDALGDQRCVSGMGIYVYDSMSGLYGKFWIKSDSHSWSGGKHTMSLTLTLKNVTENPEVSYDKPSRSGSSYRTTGRMKGRKVKALFTGYYPANNSLQGGYYAKNGERLNPARRTCAAPESVPFDKKVQVLRTHTSKDNKIFRVNDRGGAINISGGRYHFDILFKNHAAAYAFGRRKGYAIIGNGEMVRIKDGGSAKGRKLVKFAKRFIGKSHYVLGASNPNGACDCSGYVMYCYRHALGIKLPHYSVEQAKKGKKIRKISQLQAGDIVIMHTGWRHNARNIPDHVGIYAGNGMLLQVGHSGCTYQKMSKFRNVFLYGRRLI